MRYLITGGSGFIGTSLIEELLNHGHDIINIDINKPKISTHDYVWKKIDILDRDKVSKVVQEFRPQCVIHLAARTDTYGTKLSDYNVNTKGTSNILEAVNGSDAIHTLIIASTQFVNQYNGIPSDDEDYAPHTIYGESKVITERLTREANLDCCVFIVRPTNIWGAWHPRYPHEFWKILSKGMYFHPGNNKVIRSYGYVKNIVFQLIRMSEIENCEKKCEVYYLSDEPIDLIDWVNEFSIQQTGRRVKVIPSLLVKFIAITGDMLGILGIRFPITSSRYKSMTTSNGIPVKKTFEMFGIPPYSMKEGVKETVKWMKIHHPDLVTRNKN